MSVPHGTHAAPRSGIDAGNDLLRLLSPAIRSGLLRHAQVLVMERGHQVFAPGEAIKEVFFPVTGVCSLLLGLRSGQNAGTGTIGNEGMVGIPAVLDTLPTERAVVQIGGDMVALPATILRRQMERHQSLRQVLRRYVACSYDMAKQNSVCNAFHAIDERVARWLLISCDRTRTDCLPYTQDLLSQMVAASRPRVNEAIVRLGAKGIVEYGRGFVRVLDRGGLERLSCECYAAMRDWSKRFTPSGR